MRKLVAAYACRMRGTRLYGKPLQNLDIEEGVTVLDNIISLAQTIAPIQSIVLGIAKGFANLPFVEFAERRRIGYILGDEKDVLERLIQCGHKAQATDIFRNTSESPFCYYDIVDEVWERHLEAGNDVTCIDGTPDGSYFEIYTMEALEKSHKLGEDRHRSELCGLYIKEHRSDFKVEVMSAPRQVQRPDLRLTVDYPEDLALCRHIYAHLKHKAPRLPLDEIIEFIDNHPELQAMVAPYVEQGKVWHI